MFFKKSYPCLEGIKSNTYSSNIAELSMERTEKSCKSHNGKTCAVQQPRSGKHNYKLSWLEYNKAEKKIQILISKLLEKCQVLYESLR